MKTKTQSQGELSMDVMSMLTGAGISVGVGIVGKAVGFWKDNGITEVQMQERLGTLKKELEATASTAKQTNAEFNSNLKETVNELRAVVLTVAKLQSSQDVTNVMVTKTLESLVKRCDNSDNMSQETQTMLGSLIGELKRQNGKM